MDEAGPSTAPGVRSSSRARVKSQRAMESEDTNRLLAIAKARARAAAEAGSTTDADGDSFPATAGDDHTAVSAPEGASADAESSTAARKRGSRGGRKAATARKAKQEETWCICKSTESDRPMIECGHCNDW